MCDIIWPPAPFKICYLARNLKELHEVAIEEQYSGKHLYMQHLT